MWPIIRRTNTIARRRTTTSNIFKKVIILIANKGGVTKVLIKNLESKLNLN